jgi:hypothetical protein
MDGVRTWDNLGLGSREELKRRREKFIAAWVICLVILSLQPVRFGLTRFGAPTHLILHVLVFGFTTFLLQLLSTGRGFAWIALVGTLCLAAGIEWVQSLIYRQAFESEDLYADVLGIVFAILLRVLWERSRKTV